MSLEVPDAAKGFVCAHLKTCPPCAQWFKDRVMKSATGSVPDECIEFRRIMNSDEIWEINPGTPTWDWLEDHLNSCETCHIFVAYSPSESPDLSKTVHNNPDFS